MLVVHVSCLPSRPPGLAFFVDLHAHVNEAGCFPWDSVVSRDVGTETREEGEIQMQTWITFSHSLLSFHSLLWMSMLHGHFLPLGFHRCSISSLFASAFCILCFSFLSFRLVKRCLNVCCLRSFSHSIVLNLISTHATSETQATAAIRLTQPRTSKMGKEERKAGRDTQACRVGDLDISSFACSCFSPFPFVDHPFCGSALSILFLPCPVSYCLSQCVCM